MLTVFPEGTPGSPSPGKNTQTRMIIQSLLDTDLYKFSMQQVVFHRFPQADAEYRFQCRDAAVDLRPFADAIRAEVDNFCALSFTEPELEYLHSVRFLHPSYVDSLRGLRLNPAHMHITTEPEFGIWVAGNWYSTILLEVPLLAIVNEVYFAHAHPFTQSVEQEGERRLRGKIRLLQNADGPPLNLIEFGTRRRYSRVWQRHVINALQGVPEHLSGTSNVLAAKELGLKPFGTMAHEFLQAFQSFAALPDFQKAALETWMQEYRGDLGIALSDVVGMDAFLRDFDRLFAKAYDGARHDSGDPYEWGEKLIAHYQTLGIDPATKYAVWSDSLDIPKCFALERHFRGRIHTSFGVGTNLTNDLGFDALPVVLKMTRCNGRPVAKLSDSAGKHMSTDPVFLKYLRQTFQIAAPQTAVTPFAPRKNKGAL